MAQNGFAPASVALGGGSPRIPPRPQNKYLRQSCRLGAAGCRGATPANYGPRAAQGTSPICSPALPRVRSPPAGLACLLGAVPPKPDERLLVPARSARVSSPSSTCSPPSGPHARVAAVGASGPRRRRQPCRGSSPKEHSPRARGRRDSGATSRPHPAGGGPRPTYGTAVGPVTAAAGVSLGSCHRIAQPRRTTPTSVYLVQRRNKSSPPH